MKKKVFVFLCIFIGIICVIMILRTYNHYRYRNVNKNLVMPKYYQDVTNISLYPKNIDGIGIEYIDYGRFQGFHMIPDQKLYKGVIICYGGSEGSPNFEDAKRLALMGYETLAVFMFGMKNQPKTLGRIPLEQFEDVLGYIKEKIDQPSPMTVLGVSKSAEYSLHLATKYKEISNLILISPSSYTFAGLDFDNYGSSWTYRNQELPYIDLKKSSLFVFVKGMLLPMLLQSPVSYKEIYDSAVSCDIESDKKFIPVQEVKANILMIAGQDDQMWDSYGMARMIENKSPDAILVDYENAGHIFGGDGVIATPTIKIKTGGNRAGNERANLESIKAIDAFLEKYHP